MKKRKSSLLQRMLAVLLAAVLVTGMAWDAAPMTVLADELGGQQESAGENKAETVEGDTKPAEETVTTLAETTKPEEPKPEDGIKQETSEPEDRIKQEMLEPEDRTEEETLEPGKKDETEQETVSENDADEENGILQALLARIAALPDAEEYLATEPDVDGGEADEVAYEEWLAGLYAHAEEALAIQEAVEELSEEEQAQIPEEALAKLAAWAAVAQTAGESAQFTAAESSMAMTVSPVTQTGDLDSGTDWVLDANGKLTISSDEGMADWEKIRAVTNSNGEIRYNLVKSVEMTGVTSIVDDAFSECNMTEVSIPDDVTSIGARAFRFCSQLGTITIPGNVESIGGYAFYGCTNLQTVTVRAEKPPKLGEGALGSYGSYGNTQFYVPNCTYKNADGWIKYRSRIVIENNNHVGDIGYSTSGSVITQKCKGCNTENGTATLSLSGTDHTYTGNPITPVSVTYADSGTNTWSGEKPTDITYENNVNAGQATASLTLGTGEDAATVTLTFTIRPKSLTGDMVTLSGDSFLHTGNAVTPEVTVQNGGTTLTEGTDYTVSYSNNSAIGTATVTVTGKGNYSGTVTKQFQIVESDASKVARAKTVVENALAGYTATNATTEAEILGVINTALSEASITDATVAIAKFRKTEATTSAAGNILVDVSIECGQEVQSVSKTKSIAQLTAGRYTVAVNGGLGGGEYAAGDTVTIKANAPASGKQFDRWVVNSGNVTLIDATSSSTTFTMPTEAVSVTATYKDKTNTGDGSGDHSGGNSGNSGGSGSHSGGSNADSSNNNNDNDGFDGDSNNNGAGGNNDSGNGTAGGSHTGGNGADMPVKAPATVITTQPKNLEDAVLTEPEKQQKAAGADIRIELDVKVVTAEASAADRALVEEALRSSAAGYTLGQYLDISLYKVIGDSRTAIRETDGKITIRIDVPDALKNTDGSRTRTFAVIRVHDGRTEFLADLDTDNDTITIETDRFSTYAVIYKDMADGGNGGSIQLSAENGSGKGSGRGKDNEPKTGDATPLELSATLAMIAGFAYLLLYFADRERGMTEERKKELVSQLVRWAKQGGRIRKYLALAAIFVLLVYYHSIGKKTCTEWKAIYGE